MLLPPEKHKRDFSHGRPILLSCILLCFLGPGRADGVGASFRQVPGCDRTFEPLPPGPQVWRGCKRPGCWRWLLLAPSPEAPPSHGSHFLHLCESGLWLSHEREEDCQPSSQRLTRDRKCDWLDQCSHPTAQRAWTSDVHEWSGPLAVGGRTPCPERMGAVSSCVPRAVEPSWDARFQLWCATIWTENIGSSPNVL